MMGESELQSIIELCRSEPEVDRQVEFLQRINENLPSTIQIAMPSLLTDDFVGRALDTIEERIMLSKKAAYETSCR